LGIEASTYIKAGSLVPDDLIVDLVVNNIDESNSILLDGFPRTLNQAKVLDNKFELNMVLNLEVPEDEIISRLENRRVHVASGRVYHLIWNPPKEEGKDDFTGEPLMQRPDDTFEAIQERLALYNASTRPLIDYYKEKGVLETFVGTESNVIYPIMKDFVEIICEKQEDL
jgi:adenylate kinase family enzyme